MGIDDWMLTFEMLGTVFAESIGLMWEGSDADIWKVRLAEVDKMKNSSLLHEVNLIKLNTF